MAPLESLLVAVFDHPTRRYKVLGQTGMSFATEDAARSAGCIVVKGPPVPSGVVAGVVNHLSPTESAGQIAKRPLVISQVPGTVQLPTVAQRPPRSLGSTAIRERDAPRSRRR